MPGLGEPPVFPSMVLPDAPSFPTPILELPSAEIPNYKPIVVPPADLRPPPGIKGKPLEGKQPNTKPNTPTTPKAPEVDYVTIPVIDKEVPIPSQEILVTAVSTATVSVAATLTALSLIHI